MLECFKRLISLLQLRVYDIEIRKENLELICCLLVIQHEVLIVLLGLIMRLLDTHSSWMVYMALWVYLSCLWSQSGVYLAHLYIQTITNKIRLTLY